MIFPHFPYVATLRGVRPVHARSVRACVVLHNLYYTKAKAHTNTCALGRVLGGNWYGSIVARFITMARQNNY